MLRPYHLAPGRRKVGPYEVHLAVGRGGIGAEPILFDATRLGHGEANPMPPPSGGGREPTHREMNLVGADLASARG